jgi:poly(3-hydroxybutyrate) depolymerase
VDTDDAHALVIVTHGANQPATAPFQRPMTNPTLARTAEARGFIVAAVTGYHANATAVGGWKVPYAMVPAPNANAGGAGGGGRGGRRVGGPAPAPPTAEDFRRAEMDVLYVTDLVAKEYDADPARVYLMGNSAGGSAVWTYATRYPERWTAIAPSAAPLEDAMFPYEKLKTVPVLVIHGDADSTMSFEASKLRNPQSARPVADGRGALGPRLADRGPTRAGDDCLSGVERSRHVPASEADHDCGRVVRHDRHRRRPPRGDLWAAVSRQRTATDFR